MGGDRRGAVIKYVRYALKSAPPVWAGTACGYQGGIGAILKSAPPVWAGTSTGKSRFETAWKLKSAPPVWAGTTCPGSQGLPRSDLNPPRPCGRGPWMRMLSFRIRYLNPPRPCGRGHGRQAANLRFTNHLNPPRPCGRGPSVVLPFSHV